MARVYAISDIHVDYQENRLWVDNLSRVEYKKDTLILVGDVTDDLNLLEETFRKLGRRFYRVHFVPGNHDLWVRSYRGIDSLEKLRLIGEIAGACGVCMESCNYGTLSLVPLYGWYDYSFGTPGETMLERWMDYYACRWPAGFDEDEITGHFLRLNTDRLGIRNKHVITFSHFVPRIDLLPAFIPEKRREVYPMLGSVLLEQQIRAVKPALHIFGHSHINLEVAVDGIRYLNSALGYPHETLISARKLRRVF